MENFSRSDSIPERVRQQYNRAPYPQVSWLATCSQTSVVHGTYETGAALTYQKIESHENKRIGLLGCGTFEPYAMGSWQSGAQIDAVDLSAKSLRRAKVRCRLHGIRNVKFFENDLNKFCRLNENTYDYIQCYGVLHHLENPKLGFESVSRALKPQGFARIMVYAKTSRRRPQMIQKAASLLFKESSSVTQLKKLMDALPWNHPLKLSFFLNSDNQTKNGIVDSSLHACENSFSLQELLAVLDESGLQLTAWDFSQNILNLLKAEGPESVLDKIFELEAFDQWPASFTFLGAKERHTISRPHDSSENPRSFFRALALEAERVFNGLKAFDYVDGKSF